MNHIEWKTNETSNFGPITHYGYWEGAKCFSVFMPMRAKSDKPSATPYQLKSMLPGFRPDLPMQKSVEDAKAFAERMLQRWVAKRGLLFKSHIVVTDNMRAAAQAEYEGVLNKPISEYEIEMIIRAALDARG